MKTNITLLALLILLTACSQKQPNEEASKSNTKAITEAAVSVNDKNYALAMLDMAMQKEFAQGADNAWNHHRSPMPLDAQPAPMMNKDTLYSFAILDARGDIAITLPESGGRYMSLHVVNHEHVTYKVFYGSGRHIIPADETTDFIMVDVRIRVNSQNTEDLKKANALQDKYRIEHLNGYNPESFRATQWNMDDFNHIHAKYVNIAQKEGVLGTMGTVDAPVSTADRNRGVSIATGLLPDDAAVYLTAEYKLEKGKTYKATYPIPDMVDPKLGFYSITIYGDDQYLHTVKGSTISNYEIKNNSGGRSFDIHYVSEETFGVHPNELIMPTETFWINMRIYMPGDSVKSGSYTLPVPEKI